MEIKADCLHFLGDRPCEPHKREGVHCDDCPHYEPVDKRILIIKLGAMGDVIRTTPLIRKLREVWPKAEISWLTYHPELIPPPKLITSYPLNQNMFCPFWPTTSTSSTTWTRTRRPAPLPA